VDLDGHGEQLEDDDVQGALIGTASLVLESNRQGAAGAQDGRGWAFDRRVMMAAPGPASLAVSSLHSHQEWEEAGAAM
jgi:hypothetical protein